MNSRKTILLWRSLQLLAVAAAGAGYVFVSARYVGPWLMGGNFVAIMTAFFVVPFLMGLLFKQLPITSGTVFDLTMTATITLMMIFDPSGRGIQTSAAYPALEALIVIAFVFFIAQLMGWFGRVLRLRSDEPPAGQGWMKQQP